MFKKVILRIVCCIAFIWLVGSAVGIMTDIQLQQINDETTEWTLRYDRR